MFGCFICDLLTLCLLHAFLLSADFFQNQLFRNILSGIPSECLENSIDPDQAPQFVGPDLGSNCLQKLSVGGTSRQS